MTQIKATHTFQGMDKDTADRFMKSGMYRDALNVHIGSSEGDGMFSVENVKGNTLVYYALPVGTNQVIGSHEDIVNKCIYYFLCNENDLNIQSTSGSNVVTTTSHGLSLTDLVTISGISARPDIVGNWIINPTSNISFVVLNPLTSIDLSQQSIALSGTSGATGIVKTYQHSILKYDSIANSISLVYKHSRLNFDKDHVITGTGLLNSVLHWTDDFYNPPRSLNLTQVSTYGTYFVEGMIDFIRIPPTRPCNLSGSWVNTFGVSVPYIGTNINLPNSMNDKTYQFIYRYVYYDDTRSVWSPVSTSMVTGFVNDRINRIDITIINEETALFIYYSKVIKNIEIAFRDGTELSFKYIDRLNFPTTTTSVSYSFYNNTAYSLIDTSDTNKYFESVPKIAGALGTEQNRIFLGDCLEGFNVDKNTFNASELTYGGDFLTNSINWKLYSDYDVGIVFCDRADRKSGVYKLLQVRGLANSSNQRIPIFVLNGQPPTWATHYQIVRSNNLTKTWFIQGFSTYYRSIGNTTEIVFNGNNGNLYYVPSIGDYIISSDTSSFGSPAINSPTPYKILGSGVDNVGRQTIILDGIANEIIFSASGVVEIYTPNTIKDQLFYEIGYVSPVKDPGTPQRSFFSNGANSGTINLSTILSGDVYIRPLNDALSYHSRVTIEITGTSGIPNTRIELGINGTENYVVISNKSNEVDIANEFINKINTTSQFNKAFLSNTGNGTSFFVIYDLRQGSLGNINITKIISSANVTQISQFGSTINGFTAQQIKSFSFFEAMSSNDNNLTWDQNIGRGNILLIYGDQEKRRGTLIRFGGKFLIDTLINSVNNFDSLDQEQLTNFGNIRKLIAASNNQAEGSVLLAVQENEISSIYVGQIVIKNAGGGQNVSTTDKVIGTVNSLQKLVGTINPESVVQNNGIIYGFDALRGIVWRYGQDGLTFLSDEGVKNFFYLSSSYLLSNGSPKCFASIDPYNNEYILSVPNTDATQVTLAWSETLNKWTSFMSYIGEWYQKINTQMVSFKDGQLWLHRSNSLFNNFYGVQYTSKIKMICAQEPENTKILQIIQQKSNGSQWDCIDIATPEGQSSELIGLFDISNPNVYPQDFRKYDNTTYVGAVLRDKNTPNMAASDYPLLRGDVIRDDIFSVLMENNKTSKQNLYFVDLLYVHSYKNP